MAFNEGADDCSLQSFGRCRFFERGTGVNFAAPFAGHPVGSGDLLADAKITLV
jgi:hypothetical protein